MKQIMILLSVLVLKSVGATADDGFSRVFKLERTVALDSTAMIAYVWNLVVGNQGELIITDRVGKSAFIFASNGKLRKTLRPQDCFPGFIFDPLACGVNKQSGQIYLFNNSAPSGYRFDRDGNCIGPLDLHMIRGELMCVDRKGFIYTYNVNAQFSFSVIVSDSVGRKLTTFGDMPSEYAGYIHRNVGGGVHVDRNGNAYVANVAEPKIYKYGPDRKLIRVISDPPRYFRPVEKLPRGFGLAPGEHMKVAKKWFERTLTRKVFLVSDDKLLLCYDLQNGKFGYQVFDLDGRNLTNADLIHSSEVLYAGDDRLYFSEQPEPDKTGNLPNPIIKVYRIVLGE